jgi:acetolactate synthase I/II/III large subunit
MRVKTTGRVFSETLKGHGVTHVFYVPAFFLTASAEMKDAGITRVVTHHEVAAAYMADGYARASHRPGVCMAQQVGAANMAAGLRDAYLASSPVIAVTGGVHPESRYRYLYQVIEDFPMYEPVTKFNARVERPSRLPDLLRQAFRESTTGTPGPVHLELPGRMGEVAEGEGEYEVIVEQQYSRVPPHRPEPDMTQLQEAAELLAASKRPVIVAGGGVITSGAEAEVVKLAEKLRIPVAFSPTGKGTIAEDHPLAIGMVGSYGRRPVNQMVKEADLVFFVGSRAGDMTTDHYTTPPVGTPAIQLDINPAETGRVYPVKVALVGDARVALARLIEAVEPATGKRDAWAQRAQELLRKWRAEVEPLAASDASPIRPERLCREIEQFLPEGGVVVADTGHATIWSGTMIELTKPGQRYIRCMGTLGWSFPGSLGVKCALPDRPVLCFTGDGGFYYHLAELETAARFGINTVVVVNNNSALSQVKGALYSGRDAAHWGRAEEVYAFGSTDFARVAKELGCVGVRVEKAGQIRPALQEAFAAGRPAVVDVVTDTDAMPPWS